MNELQTELEREKQRNAILKQEVERLVNVYPTENVFFFSFRKIIVSYELYFKSLRCFLSVILLKLD